MLLDMIYMSIKINRYDLYSVHLLVLDCSTAIMSYKTLPLSHEVNKVIHLTLHAIALVLGAVGIYAAFKFHNESGIDNLYSLHSWVGLGTICLYGIQVGNISNTLNLCSMSQLTTSIWFPF